MWAVPERLHRCVGRRFRRAVAYPDSATEETTESDEIPRLEGVHLDLEPVVRDAVVLSLPLTPLCAPDCAGLCRSD